MSEIEETYASNLPTGLVGKERWFCCQSTIRTDFCKHCGSARPKVFSEFAEPEDLAVEFYAEAQKCFKSSTTLLKKAAECRAKDLLEEYEPSEPWDDLQTLARHKESGSEAFVRRGNSFAYYAKVIRDLIAFKLSAPTGNWIKTIDALPEVGETVLVYYIALDPDGTPSCSGLDGRGGQIDMAFYEEIEGDSHWMGAECLPDTKVSHWMALPLTPIQQAV